MSGEEKVTKSKSIPLPKSSTTPAPISTPNSLTPPTQSNPNPPNPHTSSPLSPCYVAVSEPLYRDTYVIIGADLDLDSLLVPSSSPSPLPIYTLLLITMAHLPLAGTLQAEALDRHHLSGQALLILSDGPRASGAGSSLSSMVRISETRPAGCTIRRVRLMTG